MIIILVPGGKLITETNRKYDSNKIITEIMTRHYALGSYDLIGDYAINLCSKAISRPRTFA